MGQEQEIAKTAEHILGHTTNYQYDIRLVEYFRELPSYFSTSSQKIIEELEAITARIGPHPLEAYLTTSIDLRFSKYNSISKQVLASGKPLN